MRQKRDEEPLLPPWVIGLGLKLAPLVVVGLLYYLLNTVFRVPGKIAVPVLIVAVLAVLIYFGGRFYKPFYADRDGRCTARGGKQKGGCRHFMMGARLGGGCGRHREDGKCRYVR